MYIVLLWSKYVSFNSILFFLCVCSSKHADGGRGQTHKEVMITVTEMKKRLPTDKYSRSKTSTVEALNYALHCVKQVQGRHPETLIYCFVQSVRVPDVLRQHVCLSSSVANSEYYKLLMRNGQDDRRDATVCTREELERVTSEHTLKNTVNTHAYTQEQVPLNLHVQTFQPSITYIAYVVFWSYIIFCYWSKALSQLRTFLKM